MVGSLLLKECLMSPLVGNPQPHGCIAQPLYGEDVCWLPAGNLEPPVSMPFLCAGNVFAALAMSMLRLRANPSEFGSRGV